MLYPRSFHRPGRGRCRLSRCCCSSKAWPGRCPSPASAAVRLSRPSSSAGRDEPASTRRSGVLDAHVDQWVDRHLATRKILRPRNAAYLIISVWVFAIVIFGVIERLVDPRTFPSVWLAFWWAIQTVTTVGYGDVVPKQTSGKFFAAILMLGGLSIISIITATVTSASVTRRQAELQATGDDPV